MRVATALILMSTSSAGAESLATRGRDTDRVMLGIAAEVFASSPMAIEDPGFAAIAGKPLWLGNRHRFFQWVVDADLIVGFGTDSHHAHLAINPHAGFNLYFGSVFGFELRVGVSGIAQLGPHSALGLGASGTGAYVFRLWNDDRRRLKLLVLMHAGAFLADDPGSDLATGAGGFGAGLAYEMPY